MCGERLSVYRRATWFGTESGSQLVSNIEHARFQLRLYNTAIRLGIPTKFPSCYQRAFIGLEVATA